MRSGALSVPVRRRAGLSHTPVSTGSRSRLRLQRLEMLADFASRLLEGQDPDREGLPALFRSMRAEMSVDASLGYVVADVDAGLKLRFAEGLDAIAVERCLRLDFGQAICGTVAATGKPMHVTDIQDSDDVRANLVRDMGISAYACEPIMVAGRVVGTLSFASRTRRSFDNEDLTFFRLVARHVALARERALESIAAERAQRELRHRVRNLLGNVQAVAAISARSAKDIRQFIHELSDRIVALGFTQDLVNCGSAGVDLAELMRAQLGENGPTQAVLVEGPQVRLGDDVAVPLGMAVHELKTNAMRFGALSSPAGEVRVRWRVEDDGLRRRVRIDWRERGGPAVSEPTRNGFGTQLLEGLLGSQIRVSRSFAADGLRASIEIDLSDC